MFSLTNLGKLPIKVEMQKGVCNEDMEIHPNTYSTRFPQHLLTNFPPIQALLAFLLEQTPLSLPSSKT